MTGVLFQPLRVFTIYGKQLAVWELFDSGMAMRRFPNEDLPRHLQVTSDHVQAVGTMWENGFAELTDRLNHLIAEIHPEEPHLGLPVTDRRTGQSLQSHFELFRAALPVVLCQRIIRHVDLFSMQESSGRRRRVARIPLRDDNRVYPWALGQVALGVKSGNLDIDYKRETDRLVAMRPTAQWLVQNVIKPTKSHASVWRKLIHTWQKEYSAPEPAASRLSVNVETQTAYLDGMAYPLDSELSAHFLSALLQKPGAFVSSTDMGKSNPQLSGTRIDRLRIPPQIRALVDSKPGSGYRVLLEGRP